MEQFDPQVLKKLYSPASASHKGQNGKVLIIAGSHLFHAASLWPLTVASRIVDMVFYASVPENNEIVQKAKEEFRDGIVIPRENIDSYIKEADCILIGPGMPRVEGQEAGDDDTKELTQRLLAQYPEKKWVVDGGSLQTIDPEVLLGLNMPILTPHHREFEKLFEAELGIKSVSSQAPLMNHESREKQVEMMAKKFGVVILSKGVEDIVSSPTQAVKISGGNPGMTKGGTGDVLAGLVASLYAQNDDPFLVASAASYINKKAGESLSRKVGIYFNASDLASEIPIVMDELT